MYSKASSSSQKLSPATPSTRTPASSMYFRSSSWALRRRDSTSRGENALCALGSTFLEM